MEDYNKVLDATEVAENANGVAAEKMTVYNESLAAAQNRLTASIQQFAQDSNLDQILAKAYDGLSKIVDILNILLNKIPILSPLIKALGVTLAAAFAQNVLTNLSKTNTGIGTMVSIVTNAIPKLVSFASILKGKVVAALAATSGGLAGLKAVLTAVTATVTTFINPVTLAVAAIGALMVIVPKVVDAFNDFKNAKEKALEKSTQELEEANQNLEETNSQIKDIQDKIAEINNKGTLTLTDQAEKDRLEEQLDTLKEIQQVQQEIAQQKVEKQAQDVRDVVRSKYASTQTSDEALSHLREEAAGYEKQGYGTLEFLDARVYDTASASIQQLSANIQFLEEQKKNLNAADADYQENLDKINELEKENVAQLQSEKLELLEYKNTMIEAGDTSSDEYQTVVDRINDITVALDPSKLPKVSLSEMISTEGMEEKIKMVVETGSEAGKKVATSYAENFAEEISKNDSLRKSWAEALNIDENELKNNTSVLTQEIVSLFYQMYGDISSGSSEVTDSISSQKTALELYQEAVQQTHDNTTDLTSAYQDMIDKGYISETVVKKLTAAHPELVKELKLENGQYTINLQTLKDVYKAEADKAINSIKSEKAQTEATIQAIQTRIAGYQEEATILAQASGELTPEEKARQIGLQHSLDRANWELEEQQNKARELDKYINQLNTELYDWSPTSTKSGSKSSKKSDAEKEFENQVKNIPKQLKTLVTLYSEEDAWNSQEVITNYKNQYKEMLEKVVNDPAARKILAESYNLDISNMPVEEQVDKLTTLIKKDAGTIEEAQQKLIKSSLDAQEKELKARQEIEKQEKEQYDKALEYIEDLEDATVSMIETGIDLLEKAGDIVFNLLGKISDRYDKQLDNLDKISDELDKQKDAFEEKIDAQKEMLKLQKEEKDNADELAEKNKSIADIDAQLMELQYDNSAEAQAKRLKLLDERAEKEKDLADWQNEYDYNVKIDALDKEKSEYEKTIEAEKKALEAQKETIEAAQKSFETTLSNIQNGFNTFIKILSSDVIKNLLSRALISSGGEIYQNLLYGWNRIFGTGQDATISNALSKGYEALAGTGWTFGSSVTGAKNALTAASNAKQGNIDIISDAMSGISIKKNQLEAGQIDLTKPFTSGIDVDAIKDKLNQVGLAFDNAKMNMGNILGKLKDGFTETFGNIGKNIVKFANGISGNIQQGIQNAAGLFDGLKSSLGNVFNIDWSGITGSVQDGLQIVSNTFSQMFNPVAKGASSIGDAIGSGITGFFPGIFSALGKLVTAVGTAMGGVLQSIGEAMASIPVVGWVIAAAAIAGAIALVATIAGIVSKTNSTKVSQPTQSFTAKKHHQGADYVKKQNPELDRMLGLGNDETVSILKVGEAVVPTWANRANSSSNSNSYTGSPFGSAVDSAVKSARVGAQASYSTGDSSVSISMPINIQGDADATTVKALKKEADNIVNNVLKVINKQTRLGGYRNIKAATV